MSNELLLALQNRSIYPHSIKGFDVIQTHLSWIILTGDFAYKIKKPLNLGFQDFSTLEKRKRYCELEVALNKRLAPQVYIETLPITGTTLNPQLAGSGPVIEYVVKMNQFPQENLLSNLIKSNSLTKAIIESLAAQTADFHQHAQICDNQLDFGNPQSVYAPMVDNFNALKSLEASKSYSKEINDIEAWCEHQFKALNPLLTERKKNGYIRACHGDFHLGNMVLLEGKPVVFDCIEFNESFRWTDVMNDVCFLAMDLDKHQLSSLGNLFVNTYLEHTGDYDGAKLLHFYKSYRAMVRAKISTLQLNQVEENSPFAQQLKQDLQDFLALAKRYATAEKPTLSITHGLSGAGKSIYTEHLLMQSGAIRLRADIIRKHLFKLNPFTSTPESQLSDLYSPQATQKVYETLAELAKTLVQAGYSVIIDAACLKQWQRQYFIDVANNNGITYTFLAFESDLAVLKQRIALRAQFEKISDATFDVLLRQQAELEPLTEAEKAHCRYIALAEIDKLIDDKFFSHSR